MWGGGATIVNALGQGPLVRVAALCLVVFIGISDDSQTLLDPTTPSFWAWLAIPDPLSCMQVSTLKMEKGFLGPGLLSTSHIQGQSVDHIHNF